ncbi:MAG: CRISPR-associated helicase Cas3' [Methanoregula sp.]|jgi:CRISPR-associated endonuclease/helicase Cas3
MTEDSENFYRYWGKASPAIEATNTREYHLLAYHCLDVAAVGQRLLQQDPALVQKIIPADFLRDDPRREQWFIDVITFLLALHDCGKFSDRFQNRLPDLFLELKGHPYDRFYTVHHTDMGRLLFERVIWNDICDRNWFCLNPEDDRDDWKDTWKPWFYAVAGHHGKPPVKPEAQISSLFENENRQSVIQFTEACAALFLTTKGVSPQTFDETFIPTFARVSWLLAGLTVLCDWIGSDSVHFTFSSTPMPLETYWNEYALPHAETAVQKFGILPASTSLKTGMDALFPAISSPTPLQSFVETCEIPETPQLFIIEEATGSGKTEAALVLAHRLMQQGLGEGVYFGLPTMATANAMYDRMSHAYGSMFSSSSHPSLVLVHSGSKFSERFQQSIGYPDRTVAEEGYPEERSASAQCNEWLSDNRKKALLAQVGVGTIDQALIAVLPLHHQCLRLLGLSRNVLIVDEVHAYDSYVERVLENLLQFHAALGGSAILLSATLPHAMRQALVTAYSSGAGICTQEIQRSDYPMVTHVISHTEEPKEYAIPRCEMTHRTIEVECTDDPLRVMTYLSEVRDAGKCACWVRNTVDDAISSYETLSQRFGTDRVRLFHARFTMGDRIRIETDVLNLFGKDSTPELRKGQILVATQVVEQSLDLDFDLMVTDLAPMDLVIQRAGRLHRHTDPKKRGIRGIPKLVVFSPSVSLNPSIDWYTSLFPRGAYVYQNHGQLWLTARLLATRKQITMPDDARLLIEGTFGGDAQQEIPEQLMDLAIRADGTNMANSAIAQLNILNLDDGYKSTPTQWQDDARTPTRLGDVRVTVLLLAWEGSALRFYYPDPKFAADLSQVNISDNKISKECSYTGELATALLKFKAQLPDNGRWRILVPLTRATDGWQGRALDRNGNEVLILYDSRLGFRTTKP